MRLSSRRRRPQCRTDPAARCRPLVGTAEIPPAQSPDTGTGHSFPELWADRASAGKEAEEGRQLGHQILQAAPAVIRGYFQHELPANAARRAPRELTDGLRSLRTQAGGGPDGEQARGTVHVKPRRGSGRQERPVWPRIQLPCEAHAGPRRVESLSSEPPSESLEGIAEQGQYRVGSRGAREQGNDHRDVRCLESMANWGADVAIGAEQSSTRAGKVLPRKSGHQHC